MEPSPHEVHVAAQASYTLKPTRLENKLVDSDTSKLVRTCRNMLLVFTWPKCHQLLSLLMICPLSYRAGPCKHGAAAASMPCHELGLHALCDFQVYRQKSK